MTAAVSAERRFALSSRMYVPLANLLLRLASFGGKFGLSLFVARFLDLADLGVYGIVFGLSMFMVVLLGGRIDHELCRRIVLSGYLDLRAVGVATFYASFSNAVVTLVASSCLAVVLPRLVRIADDRDWDAFRTELCGAGRSIILIGLPLCLGIAIVIPYAGFLLHKPELFANRYTLFALMAAAMLRLLAEGTFVGLYALRFDVPIWLGNIAFLALSLLANTYFIAKFGLLGLGLANIIVALFLLVFRSWTLMVCSRSARGSK